MSNSLTQEIGPVESRIQDLCEDLATKKKKKNGSCGHEKIGASHPVLKIYKPYYFGEV